MATIERRNIKTSVIPFVMFQPFFSHEDSEMQRVNLEMLVTANNKDMENATEQQGAFRQGAAANFVFLVGDRLNLSHQTSFLAVELLDRFMMKHIDFLWQTVISSQGSDQQKHGEWEEIMLHLEKHLQLRAVSCCQVASKFNSTHEAVHLEMAKALLSEMGHNYSKNAIFISEQRILKTLDYNLSFPCHYDFILAILETLDLNTRCEKLPLSRYLSVSSGLLRLLYLRCDVIYHCVLDKICPNHHQSELKKVQADKILTAVSIIATAAFISDPPHTSLVRTELHSLSHVPERHIESFMDVLLLEIQNNGK